MTFLEFKKFSQTTGIVKYLSHRGQLRTVIFFLFIGEEVGM